MSDKNSLLMEFFLSFFHSEDEITGIVSDCSGIGAAAESGIFLPLKYKQVTNPAYAF